MAPERCNIEGDCNHSVGIFVIAAVIAITWIAFARHDNGPSIAKAVNRNSGAAHAEVSQGAVLGDHHCAHPLVGVVAFRLSLEKGFYMHVNWSLVRIVLFIWVLISSFHLGRFSIEFNGTGTAWAMLILSVVTLVGALIGLAVADLLRVKPNQS